MVEKTVDLHCEGRERAGRVDLLSKFVLLYGRYINTPRDYGTGQLVSMVEVHILSNIYDEPGVTVTELARGWRRTKGAISQTVSKLEGKGFIRREKEHTDAKVVHLYVTSRGEVLCNAHRLYDETHIAQTLSVLLEDCTLEDIESFYKVLASFTNQLGQESCSLL